MAIQPGELLLFAYAETWFRSRRAAILECKR